MLVLSDVANLRERVSLLAFAKRRPYLADETAKELAVRCERWMYVAVLTACSSSTGPTSLTAAQLAAHFDSLASEACPPPYTGRLALASCSFDVYASLGPADGVVPSRVNLATSVGAGDWYGFIIRMTSPGGRADTSYTFVAYDGLNVQHAVVVDLMPPLHHPWAELLADSSKWNALDYDSVSATYSLVTTKVGGQCTVESSAAIVEARYCRTAKFQLSMNVTLNPWPGSSMPVQTITVPLQTIDGWVADSSSAGAQVVRNRFSQRER